MLESCIGYFLGCFYCRRYRPSDAIDGLNNPRQQQQWQQQQQRRQRQQQQPSLSPHTPQGSVHAFSTGSPHGTSLSSYTPQGSVHAFSTGSPYWASQSPSWSVHSSSGSLQSLVNSQNYPVPIPHRPFAWLEEENINPSGFQLPPSPPTLVPSNDPSSPGSNELFPPDEDPNKPYYMLFETDYQNFAEWQEAGRQLRLWIMNEPNQPPCPIGASTLTLPQLLQDGRWQLFSRPKNPPIEDFSDQFQQLGLQADIDPPQYQGITVSGLLFTMTVHTGPGVLFIKGIKRQKTRPGEQPIPPMSSCLQAVYQHTRDIDTLQHIFMYTVVNHDTFGFLTKHLYKPVRGLDWPHTEPITWNYGSEEYDALLATRLGKVICYLILGAWPRGTRYVSRIVTHSSNPGDCAFMRFDIEPVPVTGV